MKRLLFVMAISLFCYQPYCYCGNWTDDGVYDTSWYNDLSSSFEITTSEELAGLAYLCNNGISFERKEIVLQADIDLSGYEWQPISSFGGTMNGNFHKIENLLIDYYDSNFGAKRGFILSNTGVVCNLELTGSICLASGGYGAISAGGICVENMGEIKDCIVDCSIRAYNKNVGANNGYNHNAGGICVFNTGRIINCANKGNISAEASCYDYRARMNCAGGIAGQNDSEIINCINYGDMYTSVGYNSSSWKGSWGLPYGYSGGICGYNTGNIDNVISTGNIEAHIVKLGNNEGFNAYGGGIVAYNTGTVANSYYSSSCTISSYHVNSDGTMLSLSQLNNSSYAFTELLNENVQALNSSDICFWYNSSMVYDNIPFLLNGFTLSVSVDDISQNGVVFNAMPSDISSSAISNKGFEYRRADGTVYTKIIVTDGFSVYVDGLEASSAYVVRAFIETINGDVIYSDETDFSMSSISVETKEATNVTATSAVLNGYLQTGSTAIKSQGFLWRAESETNYNIIYTEGQDFECKLDSLTPNTVYFYQAFVLTANGDNIYGELKNFSTQSIAITFEDYNIIDCNSLYLCGNINMEISVEVIIEYKNATDSNYNKIAVCSEDDGSFEFELSDLLPNTYYDCRAYIFYNGMYTYSRIYTYRTLNVQIQTLTPLLDTYVTLRGEVYGYSNTGSVGFEYRDSNYPDIIDSYFVCSDIENGSFSSKVDNVVNYNEYKYRAFYQDEEGNKTFGEWIYFVPTDVVSKIKDVIIGGSEIMPESYNLQGAKRKNLQRGINIIRYSDGTAKKVLVK